MKMFPLVSAASLFATVAAAQAQAAVLAVIDSGLDVKHQALKENIWVNASEVPANGKDEDGDGYVDDVNGWNFAENSPKLLDERYLGTFPPDVYRYFQVQGRVIKGVATEADREWIRSKKSDAEFLKQLGRFGNFVHGTHVAGIGVKGSRSKAMGVKIIPTDKPGLSAIMSDVAPRLERDAMGVALSSPFNDMVIQFMLQMLVAQQTKVLDKTFQYASSHGAHVANCSFGTSTAAIEKVLKVALKSMLGREPSEQELKKHAKFFIGAFVGGTEKSLQSAKDTLFVFAAGNDGVNNDEMPTAPANAHVENSITVAAVLDSSGKLASFSNYGIQSVDVAAPGVMIRSTIPGGDTLEFSGTSQAAPRVANIALKIKEANPRLTPAQVKQIIIKTVDKKEALRGLVTSGGLVNEARAVAAAGLSASLALDQAVSLSLASVPPTFDAPASWDFSLARGNALGAIEPMPLPSLLPQLDE